MFGMRDEIHDHQPTAPLVGTLDVDFSSIDDEFLIVVSSRHCGRVLCKRCSVNELPIMKFNLQKPVRVCQLCNDVLTLGVGAAR